MESERIRSAPEGKKMRSAFPAENRRIPFMQRNLAVRDGTLSVSARQILTDSGRPGARAGQKTTRTRYNFGGCRPRLQGSPARAVPEREAGTETGEGKTAYSVHLKPCIHAGKHGAPRAEINRPARGRHVVKRFT